MREEITLWMIKDALNAYEGLFTILEQSIDNSYLFMCDMKTNYTKLSSQAIEYFNLPSSPYIYDMPTVWVKYIHPEDRHVFLDDFSRILSGESDIHNCEYRIMNRYGVYIWLSCKGRVVRDENGEPLFFAGAMANLGNIGKYDPTTNLKNLYEFRTDLSEYILNREKEPAVIMMIGINHFTHINEKYTYSFGNQVLRSFGHQLLEIKDRDMIVYRMDGDRFACIYPKSSKEKIQEVYQKFQDCAQHGVTVEGEKITFSIYGGALLYPEDGTEIDEIHRNLEYAFQRAKRRNEQKLVFFSKQLLKEYLKELLMQDELLECVNDGCRDFFLCYQPIVRSEGELYSCEALLRWRDKNGKVISPMEFVPILENSGTIRQVGKWVLETALKQLKEWQKVKPDLKVNVNVSYLQLQNGEFVDYVEEVLEKYGVSPESLVLELTETRKIMDMDEVRTEFEFFRTRGVKVALDDFGTGYASVSVLRDLMIDWIKIDHSFVSKLMNNESDRHIIEYLIKLCQKLKIEVCVEGIENSEIKDIVELYLPDSMQGYHFSRPVTPEIFYSKYIEK